MNDLHRKCKCGSGKKARWCCEKETPHTENTYTSLPLYYTSSFSEPRTSNDDNTDFWMTIHRFHKIANGQTPNACLSCGKCCSMEFIAIDNPDDCDIAPEHREFDTDTQKWKIKRKDGWCPYHDRTTHKCTIYDKKRPTVCSTFMRGSHYLCYEK